MLTISKYIIILYYIIFYNIASRATQSNSVYVSVLKISIVHGDSVSKSLRQNLFLRASGHCKREEKYYISDLFSWARVLKWGRKREKRRKKDTRHQRRHDSLHCPRVKWNRFWQKDTRATLRFLSCSPNFPRAPSLDSARSSMNHLLNKNSCTRDCTSDPFSTRISTHRAPRLNPM